MTWGTGARERTSSARWHRLRAKVLKRDGGICAVCHQPGADSVDHIVPVSDGGSDDIGNLRAIHKARCHAVKSAQEGARATWLKRNAGSAPIRESHPGLK
ncbi:MAG: HNH endonuclease [Mycobacterium sp.]|nr:HNH endonuclease [Mycobacterium sp.]